MATSKYGPWALIVGASSGLGAAFAEGCAHRGLNVALVARRAEALETLAGDLRNRHGIDVRTIVGDAARPAFSDDLEGATADIDIGLVIYNCAAEHHGDFFATSPANHLENIQVNCITPTLVAHRFGGRLADRGRGGLVLVTSKSALRGWPGWISYAASKAFAMSLGEGLWGELRPHGVDAHSYVVGSTYTPNYEAVQQALNTPFARSIDPVDYPPGTRLPRLPSAVAETLFPLLGTGPRLYSHPEDEGDGVAFAQRERADVVAEANPAYAAAIRATL